MSRYNHGWNIVAYSALLQVFSIGIFFYGIGVFLLPWTESLGVSRSDLTIIPIAMQIAICILSPFIGSFIDRVPARILVFGGIAAMLGALLVMSVAESVLVLILVYTLLVPFGQLMAGALMAQSLAAKWFVTRRGLALGITAAGGGVGGLVMPPLMQVLIDSYGWRSAMLYLAAGLAMLLLPLLPIVRSPPKAIEDVHAAQTNKPMVTGKFTTRQILFDPVFILITIASGIALAVQLVLSFNLPAMGRDVGGSATASTLLLSVLAGTSLVSKPIWGMLIDRLQPRHIFLAIAVSYGLSLAIIIFGLETKSYSLLLVAAIAGGFASGAVQALMGVVLATRFGGDQFGKAIGLAYPVINISAVGPIIASASYKLMASYVPGLVILGLMLVITATLMMLSPGFRQSTDSRRSTTTLEARTDGRRRR